MVARLLPPLVPARVLAQVLVQVQVQVQAQVQALGCVVVAVATEVFRLCFQHSPVGVFPEFVIHALARLQEVVSVHQLSTRVVAPQSRWLVPSQVQPARQQSQRPGILELRTLPLFLP